MAKRMIHGGRRKNSALPEPEDPHRARGSIREEAPAASMVVKLKIGNWKRNRIEKRKGKDEVKRTTRWEYREERESQVGMPGRFLE